MATEDIGLDRLMPRHEMPKALAIRWNSKREHRLTPGIPGRDAEGLIRDVSLAGARIEVHDAGQVEIGDRVEIGLGARHGVVEVRHMEIGETEGSVIFGVEFVETDELRDQIEIIVEHLRGNSGKLREAWKHAD